MLKKTITIICLVAFIFILQRLAYAQNEKIQIGIRAGLNVSNFNGYGSVFANRPGLYAGVVMNKYCTNNISVSAEPSYSQKGAIMYLYTPQKINLKVNSTAHYLDVPVMLNYRVKNNFYVNAGPQLNVLLARSSKVKNGDGTASIAGVSKLELGLTGGISYQFLKRFSGDIRYSRGLVSIIESGNTKNAFFQVGMGYFPSSLNNKR